MGVDIKWNMVEDREGPEGRGEGVWEPWRIKDIRGTEGVRKRQRIGSPGWHQPRKIITLNLVLVLLSILQ